MAKLTLASITAADLGPVHQRACKQRKECHGFEKASPPVDMNKMSCPAAESPFRVTKTQNWLVD